MSTNNDMRLPSFNPLQALDKLGKAVKSGESPAGLIQNTALPILASLLAPIAHPQNPLTTKHIQFPVRKQIEGTPQKVEVAREKALPSPEPKNALGDLDKVADALQDESVKPTLVDGKLETRGRSKLRSALEHVKSEALSAVLGKGRTGKSEDAQEVCKVMIRTLSEAQDPEKALAVGEKLKGSSWFSETLANNPELKSAFEGAQSKQQFHQLGAEFTASLSKLDDRNILSECQRAQTDPMLKEALSTSENDTVVKSLYENATKNLAAGFQDPNPFAVRRLEISPAFKKALEDHPEIKKEVAAAQEKAKAQVEHIEKALTKGLVEDPDKGDINRQQFLFDPEGFMDTAAENLEGLTEEERQILGENIEDLSALAGKNWMHLYEKPDHFVADAVSAHGSMPDLVEAKMKNLAEEGQITEAMYGSFAAQVGLPEEVKRAEESSFTPVQGARPLSEALAKKDVQGVAAAITAQTSEAYRSVSLQDMRLHAEHDKKREKLGHESSANIATETFNKISHAVKYTILTGSSPDDPGNTPPSLERSAEQFAFFVGVRDQLIEDGDFFGAMAVNSALNDNAVDRLRLEDPKAEEVGRLFDASANYAALQRAQEERQEKGPDSVPFIAPVMVEVFRWTDANPLSFERTLGVDNSVQKFAAQKEHLPESGAPAIDFTFAMESATNDKKGMYALSTAIKPREGAPDPAKIQEAFAEVRVQNSGLSSHTVTVEEEPPSMAGIAKPQDPHELKDEWKDEKGNTYATERCAIHPQLRTNLSQLEAKNRVLSEALAANPGDPLLTARLAAVNARIETTTRMLEETTWVGSNAFRDTLKGEGLEAGDSFPTALVNARVHTQEMDGTTQSVARLGVMGDMSDGFFSIDYLQDLQSCYVGDKLVWKEKFIGLIQEKQQEVAKYDGKKLNENQQKALQRASDFLSKAGGPNFKGALDERAALRSDKLEEQALQYLQLQLDSAKAAGKELDPQKPLVLIDNRWLNQRTTKLDKSGLRESEANFFRDHRAALAMLNGKEIKIAERDVPRIEGSTIFLSKQQAEGLDGVKVQTHSFLVSPQTNQKNEGMMKEHNEGAVKRLFPEEKPEAFEHLVADKKHTFHTSVDLLEAEARMEKENPNILISHGCKSVKDRGGLIGAAFYKRMRGKNPQEDYLRPKGIASTIVNQNYGSPTLKTHPMTVLKGELPEATAAMRVKQLGRLLLFGLAKAA